MIKTVVLALTTFLFPSLLTLANEPPKLLRSKHYPSLNLWVDEGVAFDSAGRLKPEFRNFTLVKNMAQNSDGRCRTYMRKAPLELFVDDDSLDATAQSSAAVVTGRVVSTSRGFVQGFPATLVGFQITDAMAKNSAETAIPTESGRMAYTFVDGAEFVTPEGAICAGVPQGVVVPKRGDLILLFAYLPTPDESGVFVPIDPAKHLVVRRGSENVFTPQRLAKDLGHLGVSSAFARVKQLRESAACQGTTQIRRAPASKAVAQRFGERGMISTSDTSREPSSYRDTI